jgi:hypothetical protein
MRLPPYPQGNTSRGSNWITIWVGPTAWLQILGSTENLLLLPTVGLRFLDCPASEMVATSNHLLSLPLKSVTTSFIKIQTERITRSHMCDFRLPPWCGWNLHSSGILRNVKWQLCTDVSGQPAAPIYNTQEVQEETIKRGKRWDKQVVPKRRSRSTSQRCVTPQKRVDHKQLYVLYSSLNIRRVIKKNEMGGARSISGMRRGA